MWNGRYGLGCREPSDILADEQCDCTMEDLYPDEYIEDRKIIKPKLGEHYHVTCYYDEEASYDTVVTEDNIEWMTQMMNADPHENDVWGFKKLEEVAGK